MGKLIKAEFMKLSKSLGYKILLLCASFVGVLLGLLVINKDVGLSDGYNVYLSTLTDSFAMISAIIFAIIFVCNEFSNRTLGMGLFSGCSRLSVLLSKAIVFLIGFMPVVFAEAVVSCAIVTIVKGFGSLDAQQWAVLIQATLLFILGSMAMGSVCFMLAVLIKNVGGTIGAGIGIMLAVQLLKSFPATAGVAKLTFLHQMELLPQPEFPVLFIAISAVTLVAALAASVYIFSKSDLK